VEFLDLLDLKESLVMLVDLVHRDSKDLEVLLAEMGEEDLEV